MKRICKIKIGLYLTAILMPVLNMNATTLLIKTNTLYDVALTPNIGLETGLGVRKYFGSHRTDQNSLSGHHLGLYAGMMTWDFELGGRGYICDYREEWGRYFGIDYGYSLPFAKNMNLDFSRSRICRRKIYGIPACA